MDIAQQETGGWIIVELGDGQVAGLAEHVNVDAFYQKLWSIHVEKTSYHTP
jgi:hypothetical protein